MAKDGKMATMTKRMKSGKTDRNGGMTKRMKSGKTDKNGEMTKGMKSVKKGEKRGRRMITRTIDEKGVKYEMSDLVNHHDADADACDDDEKKKKKIDENPIIIRQTIIKVEKSVVYKDLPEDVLKFLMVRCGVRDDNKASRKMDDNKASIEMEEDHRPVASILPGMTNLGI